MRRSNHADDRSLFAYVAALAGAALVLAPALTSVVGRPFDRRRPGSAAPSSATLEPSAPAPSVVAQRLLLAGEFAAVAATMAVFGWLLAPMVASPSLYPDSGTALSISMTLARGDLGPIWETQSPPVQDAMYALLLKLGSPWALNLPVTIGSWSLALMLGLIVWRVSGVGLSAAVPALVLLTSNTFWIQTGYLPMYSGFALAGYAGLYFALDYQVRGTGWRALVAGSVLIGAAPYVYTTALLFVFIPAIAAGCFASRAVLRRTAAVYAVMGVLMTPWLVWHVMVGGLSHIYYHPLNWFTVKYLPVVHERFWLYSQDSLPAFLLEMGRIAAQDVVATPLLLFVAPGMWYLWRRMGLRAVICCGASVCLYTAVLVVTRPAPFPRYFYPVMPLVTLLVTAGIVAVATGLTAETAGRNAKALANGPRVALIAAVWALAVLPLVGVLPDAVATAHFRYNDRLATSQGYRDLAAMADQIRRTDQGVIARDSSIQAELPENQVYTHFLLTEPEYVTFLSWPSDAAVLSVLRDRGISWVILVNETRWERDYHVWLPTTYFLRVQHYEKIRVSPNFRLAYEGEVYTLYTLADPSAVTATSQSR